MTDNKPKPKTLLEARLDVHGANQFVTELEERQAIMTKNLASIYDELKIARRKLDQAEKALIYAAKRTPLEAVNTITKNTVTKAS